MILPTPIVQLVVDPVWVPMGWMGMILIVLVRFVEEPGRSSPFTPQRSHRFQDTKEIADTTLSLEYGRPYMRDRIIFGNVVPHNIVWRTGVSSTTKLVTNQDLRFAGTFLPKGQYNLFTIPRKDGWTLIFNTEKNAWGSAYRQEFDFAKVEMETQSLSNTVDQVTIEIVEEGGGGMLQLSWENTRA